MNKNSTLIRKLNSGGEESKLGVQVGRHEGSWCRTCAVHTEATCIVAGIKSQMCTHMKMLRVHVPGICYGGMSPRVN